jgi:hypothetical protein
MKVSDRNLAILTSLCAIGMGISVWLEHRWERSLPPHRT